MSLFGANKPAGLSINTGSANLFGSNTSSAPPAGGLFGGSNSANAAKPAGSSLFGNSTSTSTAGTLFGAGAANATSSGTAPSLFGNAPAASNAPSAAGTLFGGTAAAATPNPAGSLFGGGSGGATNAGGGLFGNTGSTTNTGGGLFGNTAGATNTGGGGLFGNTSTAISSAPAAGGLFGAGNNTMNAPLSSAGGGLFGATTAAAPASNSLFGPKPAAAGSSLFGGQPAATNTNNTGGQPAGGLFGGGASMAARPAANHPAQPVPQQTQRSIFTSSIGQYTASQGPIPGVRIDASNLRPTTRFADLHEALQQELERLDTLILQQQAYADECVQAMPAVSSALDHVPADADFCQTKLQALQAALEADAADIDGLKRSTRGAADDAKIAFRNISALRAPVGYGGYGLSSQQQSGGAAGSNLVGSMAASASAGVTGPVPAGLLDGEDVGALQGRDLAQYMSRQVDEMESRLSRFRRGLTEVEGYLQGIEAGTAARVQSAQLRSVQGQNGMVVRRSADEQVRELAGVLREFEGGILAVAGKVGQARESTQQVMLEDARRGRLGVLY